MLVHRQVFNLHKPLPGHLAHGRIGYGLEFRQGNGRNTQAEHGKGSVSVRLLSHDDVSEVILVIHCDDTISKAVWPMSETVHIRQQTPTEAFTFGKETSTQVSISPSLSITS
jgi:hypothetical protein